MSLASMMELNAKSSFFWDWENLVTFNSKGVEVPKKLQLDDAEIEGMEGFEIGSFYSSGGRSDGGSASDFGYGSSSKSSKTASVDSSSNQAMKEPKFTVDAAGDDCPRDLSHQKELRGTTTCAVRTSSSSTVSGEPLMGLKLGKRMYFKDASASGGGKTTAPLPAPSSVTEKRSKSSPSTADIPRCQVEGCNLDLSSAKDYHRKHRVCESHSKSPKVVIAGVERRFCQQCSRFHGLSEFDQKKRSCRKRLSHHNARRRKPKPEIMQFSSMRLSSPYEGGHQMSLAFDQVPLSQSRPNPSPATWGNTSSSKFGQAKLGLLIPTKTGDIDELQLIHDELLDPKFNHESTQFLSSKGRLPESIHRGVDVYIPSSNIDAAQDFRALSLLSTNSWGSRGPEPDTVNSTMDAGPFPLQPASSTYWGGGRPIMPGFTASSSQKNTSNHLLQEFQLFKEPQEPGPYWF